MKMSAPEEYELQLQASDEHKSRANDDLEETTLATFPTGVNNDVDDDVNNDVDEYREYYLESGGVIKRCRLSLWARIIRKKPLFKAVLYAVLLTAYLVYFGFSMYHSFGDEGSVRLMLGTIFILLVIVKVNFGPQIRQCLCALPKTGHKGLQAYPRLLKGVRWLLYVAMVIFVASYMAVNIVRSSPRNLISLGGLAFFVAVGFLTSKHPDRAMPLVITMSATVNALYHYGILQSLVANFGWFLTFSLGTSPIESVNAAFNIFLGPPEAPLPVKPFLNIMTSSEMHAIMAAGFASIAGSVFGMLTSFGAPANHLLAASIMSAPAALAMAKLMVPETRWTKIKPHDAYTINTRKFRNVLEALSVGAVDGIQLVATIVVNQIIFIAAIGFIDTALMWFGARVGFQGVSFTLLCSYLFYPLTYLMGFSSSDLFKMGELLGIKIFANSFVGFREFGKLVLNRVDLEEYVTSSNGSWHWEGADIILDSTNKTLHGGILTKRSEVIGTYALCGLNHLGAVGVTMGILNTLAPSRKDVISKYVVRANIAGQMACFMTACIAGMLFNQDSG